MEQRKPTKSEIKRWRDEDVYPMLKEYGLHPNDESKWLLSVIVIFVVALGVLIFLAVGGYFKSEVNQNIAVTPNNTIENSYNFNPQTDNQYDINLNPNITVVIPNNFCKCGNQT